MIFIDKVRIPRFGQDRIPKERCSKNPWLSASKRNVPTDRPPHINEVIVKFCE
jgi:hypothetical protein